jgi:hypothetical protein
MTSQGLRGVDIDWEEKLEVVNAFRIKREGRECRCIGAHIHGEAMPSEGIADVQASGSIGDERET